MSLTIEELGELESDVLDELPDVLLQALIKANITGDLQKLLDMLGLAHLLSPKNRNAAYSNGTIVAIGACTLREDILIGAARSLGISRDRLELCLDYNRAQTYEYSKFEYQPKYAAILVGPVPHQTVGTGNSSSLHTSLEDKKKAGHILAEVRRLEAGGALKITKGNFKEALRDLIRRGKVTPDIEVEDPQLVYDLLNERRVC